MENWYYVVCVFVGVMLFLLIFTLASWSEVKEYFISKSINKRGSNYLKQLGAQPQTEKEAYEYLKKWINIDEKITNNDVKCEIISKNTGYEEHTETLTFSININGSLYSKTISQVEKNALLHLFTLIGIPVQKKRLRCFSSQIFYELSPTDIAILNNIEFYETEKFVEKYNKKK